MALLQCYVCYFLFFEWRRWEQFTTGLQARALALDALRTSHPIQVPIHHAEEVEQVFDAISYCKGSCIVRLVHAILGPDAFRAGLAAYMKRYAYGNTVTGDLWGAWAEASGKDVPALMASWTEQMGFPLVTVETCTWDADGGNATLTLRQRWFLADGSPLESAEDKAKKWVVPLLTATGADAAGAAPRQELMDGHAHTLTVACGGGAGGAGGARPWIKLNAGQHIPMRVAYTPGMLASLRDGVRARSLPAADRAALLEDAYALAKAGVDGMGVPALLTLLGAYKGEDNAVVWDSLEAILKSLDKLLSFAESATVRAGFQAFAADLIADAAARVGWAPRADDGHLDAKMRAALVRLQAKFGDPAAVLAEARPRFDALVADPTQSGGEACPSDYKTPVFQLVLKHGGQAEFDQCMGIYAAVSTNVEKKEVMNAIGSASSVELKRRVLDWCTGGDVKLQDFFYPIGSVARSGREGARVAWDYLREHFDRIRGLIATASASLMDAVIVYSAGFFVSFERADEIEAFFAAHPVPSSQRRLSQMLEGMRTNAKFLQSALADGQLATQAFWDGLK